MLPSFRAVSRRRVSVVVYGANTDVGKTVASCGLLQAGRRGDYTASYVKPVQTGPDTDEAWVTAHASGAAVTTLFRYRDPVSPHLAALREQRIVSDEQLAAAVGQAVREKSDEDLTLVETAGGVLSPAPSGTPQADVLARVFAPQKGPAARPSGLLVGDPRLGGISATLTAYESLCARGQRPAVVLFLGGADNAHAVEDRLKSARLSTDAQQHRTVVIVLPAIPDAPEPLDEWYADKTVRAAFSRVVRLLVDDRAFDKRHVWHPYTSLAKPGKVWKVASCAGCEITLDDGRVLTDGMASWWSAIHGYNVPGINAAIETQLKSMSHVMFGGLTHQPAIDLCRTLVDVSPQGLECVFLADSGSVSMEAALKMALQYWMAQGKRDKTTMVTISHGYHGDTLGAMSICDPVNSMHSMFRKLLTPHIFIDDLTCLRETLELHHHTVAAVVVEPVVQGAGGMRFYPAEWLQRARQLCTEYGVLLVFDEIATGFGRTGALFAADLAGVTPAIMCVGKACRGGT
ncbi:hypothetical protein DIPPA_23707 [Diplonema papillatum]|nr:hypothetical protein DIPPA_23707 [Diplonema papillatum]